jgi:hypothetical protein
MFPVDLPARSIDEVVRVVRALGKHRYVAGRLHMVHAFALEAAGRAPEPAPALSAAIEWAAAVLADETIEKDTRDPRLWRAASDEEVALVLEAFWRPGVGADMAAMQLMDRLESHGLEVASGDPFDERAEDDMHPVLIDAGWELLSLAGLDPTRHAGAIAAFGEPIDFEVARFEEESAYEPVPSLQELPALGAAELLRGADGDGDLSDTLTIWAQGHRTYHDYVLRGVARAAKLTPA